MSDRRPAHPGSAVAAEAVAAARAVLDPLLQSWRVVADYPAHIREAREAHPFDDPLGQARLVEDMFVADAIAAALARHPAGGALERVTALLTTEPDVESNPDAPALYWKRVGSTRQHVTRNRDTSLCLHCHAVCSRTRACACCWPPVSQQDLAAALTGRHPD